MRKPPPLPQDGCSSSKEPRPVRVLPNSSPLRWSPSMRGPAARWRAHVDQLVCDIKVDLCGRQSEPRASEAEKKSECAKNGKNASIEVSPEALGRVLRAHLMPAHPPTQRLGRFRVLILSF